MTFRKTAITTVVGGLAAGLVATTPAYAYKVNDNLEIKGKVFANFLSVDGNPTSAADDAASGFHFDRAYFEARGKLTPDDMVRITLDQKGPDKNVFVKYAYWQHKYDGFTTKIGQNHTPLVDYLQTEMWGHRYVQKTFADAVGAQTSSDLGVSVLGSVGDQVDYYVSLMNGEGYTKTTDGAGYALMGRAEWHGGGAHVGLFGHSETDRNGTDGHDPTRGVLYAWWANDMFQIGGQYLTADDGDYADTVAGASAFKDATGYNVLANVKLPMGNEPTAFVRYDTIDRRDSGTDETLTIVGVEFEVAKGIMLAPNFQSADPGTPGSDSVDSVGVHGQFKF